MEGEEERKVNFCRAVVNVITVKAGLAKNEKTYQISSVGKCVV